MKSLLVALTLVLTAALPVPAAEAGSLPPPIGGERPVSEGILAPAVGSQTSAHVASNGDVALAVWIDSKNGEWTVRASLLDHDGNPRWPAGVHLDEQNYPAGLYWNGTEFVLLSRGSTWMRIRVAPDGTIIDRVSMPLLGNYRLAAIANDGQRLIFISMEPGPVEVAIADRHGELLGDVVRLPEVIGRSSLNTLVAASENEFLVLRLLSRLYADYEVVADRIRMDGTIVSSVFTGIVVKNGARYAIAAGPDDYLLVLQNPGGVASAYRLANDGTTVGVVSLTDIDFNRTSYPPVVARDAGRYVIAWPFSSSPDESEARIAEVPDGAAAAVSKLLGSWRGIHNGLALAIRDQQRIVLTSVGLADAVAPFDLYAIPLSPSLAGGTPRVVAWSQLAQLPIDAAAGDNGFGVVWIENGPEKLSHVFFRRVSRTGATQGEPVRLASVPYPGSYGLWSVAVASNGSAYVVLWNAELTVWGRRIDAASGSWIDPEPFMVGTTWLPRLTPAVREDEAALPLNVEEIARIRFAGEPAVTIARTGLDPQAISFATLGTDGADYLMAWVKVDTTCQFDPCVFRPLALMVARLAPDGSALDREPLVLEGGERYPEEPSIAWAGDRYFVAWEAWVLEDVFATRLHGATVSADGVILEGSDPSTPGIALDAGEEDRVIPHVVANGDSFLLVSGGGASRGGFVDAVRFRYDTPLRSIASLPRSTVLGEGLRDPFVAAAIRNDGTLFLGWIRAAEDLAPRGYFRLFGQQERRRLARP